MQVIDICARLGMAWDRRRATVPWQMLKAEREQQAAVRRQREADARKNCEALAAVHSLREVVRVKSARISTLQSLVRQVCPRFNKFENLPPPLFVLNALSRVSCCQDRTSSECPAVTSCIFFSRACVVAVELDAGSYSARLCVCTDMVVLLSLHSASQHPTSGVNGSVSLCAFSSAVDRQQRSLGHSFFLTGDACLRSSERNF